MTESHTELRLRRLENDSTSTYDLLTAVHTDIGDVRGQLMRLVKRVDKIDSRMNDLHKNMHAGFQAARTRIDALAESVDARFDVLTESVDARFNAVDARFNAVDGRFNAIDGRFDAVDTRFDALESTLSVILSRLPEPASSVPAQAPAPAA